MIQIVPDGVQTPKIVQSGKQLSACPLSNVKSTGESRAGVSPPRARRTVHEPLARLTQPPIIQPSAAQASSERTTVAGCAQRAPTSAELAEDAHNSFFVFRTARRANTTSRWRSVG